MGGPVVVDEKQARKLATLAARRELRRRVNQSRPSGLVVYRGPSMLDGAPVVVVLTGLREASRNPKTGDMVQAWILREDIAPTEAVRTGADASICGGCPLRSLLGTGFTQRRCYVNVANGVMQVWKAFRAGNYREATTGELVLRRKVRLGAYGDPAAVPAEVWSRVLAHATGWTGYTHQWAHPSFDPRILDWCLGSVESMELAQQFQARHPGARYFRIRPVGEPRARTEAQCPAAAAARTYNRVTCESCGLCSGRRNARSVSIEAHGTSAAAF